MERRRGVEDVVVYAWLAALVVSSCGALESGSLETDRLVLERLKVAVDPAGEVLPWVTGTNPCTWAGVQCVQNRVAGLRLSGYEFTGALPASTLANLEQLRLLSLHHNRFTGPFPVELAQCTILRELYLGYNRFSGPLPDFSKLWPGMTHFNVALNNFSGEIPNSISALERLVVLDLQNNALSGGLPADLMLPHLLRFSVANNNLEGAIPVSLQNFPSSSFAGNGELCGPPTTKPCAVTPAPPVPEISGEARAPSASVDGKGGKKVELSGGAIAGIATGASVAVAALVIVCFRLLNARRGDAKFESASHVGNRVTDYDGGHGADHRGADHFKESFFAASVSSSPGKGSKRLQFLDPDKRPEFGLEELLQASAEVLGRGSMGTSYRADMAGDRVVIVKRLQGVAADRKRFASHVEKLGRLRHRHLLPLRAYYFSRDEKLLVTDFMPRGSVYSLLHGDRAGERSPLDWVSREKIALGSARALSYLHRACVKIAHGNIKSSNVLLDRDYEPYLSDYGLTCLLSPGSGGASRFVGYRALEVTDIRKISMQSDVYSFGVLMLELISGKAPTDAKEHTGVDLPNWVMSIRREDWASVALDPDLKKSNHYVEEEMGQMLQLAVACVDPIAERRPKMEEVVLLLEDITQLGHSNESFFCPGPNGKSVSPPASRYSARSCGPTPLYTRPSSGVFVVDDDL